MDRGYIDFERLHRIHRENAYFVIRAKSNLRFHRIYSHPIKQESGLICDQTIVLDSDHSSQGYPDKLRRVKYYERETGQRLTFLTNNFEIPALTIAAIYKCRWQIELFFKWIKQHLRIKAFYGTSSNAIHT